MATPLRSYDIRLDNWHGSNTSSTGAYCAQKGINIGNGIMAHYTGKSACLLCSPYKQVTLYNTAKLIGPKVDLHSMLQTSAAIQTAQ